MAEEITDIETKIFTLIRVSSAPLLVKGTQDGKPVTVLCHLLPDNGFIPLAIIVTKDIKDTLKLDL